MLSTILLVTIGIMFTFFLSGIRIVRPIERGLVETLGSYTRFAGPGFNWIIPGIERIIIVEVTEMMIESGKKQMITNDNLNATIDAVIFFRIKPDEVNVKAAMYNVTNVEEQIVALTKTALRNIIGTMTLKSANSERNKINTALQELLSKETMNWGIEVVRAELKEIDPPADVQETMNRVVKAENEKVAAIDFATAEETKADGSRRAEIKRAEGIKQATILEAEGKAQAIKLVNDAAKETMTGAALELRKIEMVERSLLNSTKVMIPSGQSLINVVDGLMQK